MYHIQLEEEQELWEPKEEEHSVVWEFKEEPECRDIQCLEDSGSALHCKKEEPEEEEIKPEVPSQFLHVSVKSEEGEPQFAVLQTVTEENREDTDAAGTVSEKLQESEQHSENSSDTDNSEDWAPSAEKSVSEEVRAKRHKCSHCGKNFKRAKYLSIHKRTHTGEKPFRCSICAKAFAQQHHLQRHIRTHTGEKLFKCSVCEKGFAEKYYLQRHTRTHTGERPFKCLVCGKSFAQNTHLQIHTQSHKGKNRFKYVFCAKSFTQSCHEPQSSVHQTLSEREHIENSSDTDSSEDWAPSAERPTLQTQSEFNEQLHGATHSNNVSEDARAKRLACSYCGKRFEYSSRLRVHERTHTGQKPFTCTVCEKSFIAMNYLNRHMRVHKGDNLFKCSICENSFSKKKDLKRHRKIHSESLHIKTHRDKNF